MANFKFLIIVHFRYCLPRSWTHSGAFHSRIDVMYARWWEAATYRHVNESHPFQLTAFRMRIDSTLEAAVKPLFYVPIMQKSQTLPCRRVEMIMEKYGECSPHFKNIKRKLFWLDACAQPSDINCINFCHIHNDIFTPEPLRGEDSVVAQIAFAEEVVTANFPLKRALERLCKQIKRNYRWVV